MKLYDYLYVDLDKAISLYSQLTGGVVEIRESQSEKRLASDNKRSYDLRVFKHEVGGETNEKEQNKETIKPHHALLQELEEKLYSTGHLLDLSTLDTAQSLKTPEIREKLKGTLCVKCTGRVVFEDYERMKKISDDFPSIVDLISKSNLWNLEETPQYQVVAKRIEMLNAIKGDKRSNARKEAKELQAEIENFRASVPAVHPLPQWILNGMKTWIDAFLPNITNIRVYPFIDVADEHLFGHLDSNNFTIADRTAFHFTYGTFPTEEFTLLGIITSVPSDDDEIFNPLGEFDKEHLEDQESIENAFRGVFRGFDGMEKLVRTCRYPRVLVHPILVYRQSAPNNTLKV